MLNGIFDRVGLHTNINKMVEMVCQPCIMVGRHPVVVYTRRMTGVGTYFQEIQKEWVRRP